MRAANHSQRFITTHERFLMNKSYFFPVVIPAAAIVFVAVQLTYEHFTGGVRSHYIFRNPNMPALSNWYGLITLPLLGIILGLRIRAQQSDVAKWAGIPVSVLVGFLSALIYGAVMAVSFALGVQIIATIAFFGLFACGLVFPIYRIEYIFGLVAGMAFVFGGVIPVLVALIVALVSFVVRSIFTQIVRAVHNRHPAK